MTSSSSCNVKLYSLKNASVARIFFGFTNDLMDEIVEVVFEMKAISLIGRSTSSRRKPGRCLFSFSVPTLYDDNTSSILVAVFLSSHLCNAYIIALFQLH